MARSKRPTALEMRELKYGDTPDAEKDRMAERLQAEGRHAEAILLFEGRGDHPALAQAVSWAVSQGNGFHLVSVARLGRPVTPQEFRSCAEAAEGRGRWMDARLCWLELEDEAAVRAIAEHLPQSLRPAAADVEPE